MYSEESLGGMTIAAIKEAAARNGYSITVTKKAEIIQEFLRQQGEVNV